MQPISVVIKDSTASIHAEVYASRAGIVIASKVDDVVDGLVMQFSLTPEFGPDDYLVRVLWKGQRFTMNTLAGKTPTWVSHADSWRDFASDARVRRSAEDFVCAHLGKQHPDAPPAQQPETGSDSASTAASVVPPPDRTDELLKVATARDTRLNERKSAWLEVATLCGITVSADIKKVVGSGSKTAVLYMPGRIAQHLSKGRKDKATHWQPPIPRPEYSDPAKSGRVRIAPPVAANADAGKPVAVNADQRIDS